MAQSDKPTAWVTLTTCRTLAEADLLAAELQVAQIPAFIPDASLLQNMDGAANTYGYVRVQVHSADYEAARELLKSVQG